MTTNPKVTPKAKPTPASSKKPAGAKARAQKAAKPASATGATRETQRPPKKPAVAKPGTGRPSSYSDAVAAKLCELIADGISLRKACELPGMPHKSTVLRWLADEALAEFRDQYACAREAQADYLAEQMLDIADEECTMVRASKHGGDDDGQVEVLFDATAVARNRLRVDTRKWLASKMAPKKYGDKITAEHTGADGGALQVHSTVQFVMPPARPDDEA